jgi:CO/xanthine dehydrogenase Mo-binding subunit
MPVIGQSLQRLDAKDKVIGKALYPGDINRPNQAMAKILFAGRPHARITRLDTTKAESMPGVVAVFTAKDVPVNEYGLIMPDQPVLCGPGSSKADADHVCFVGDQVALVVAESEAQAEAAAKEIEVEYEDLPVLTDPLKARADGAFQIHPDREHNIFCDYHIRHGDVASAFEQADIIVEGEYRTPAQEHAFLQPEAGLAYIDEEGRVTVEVGGQWTHEDREQIAHALDLPEEQVRIVYPAIGGAFGGREDMSIQIVLALAAWRLHQMGIERPVKIIWSREESIIGHHKRHPFVIRAKWGATKDGKIVAAEMEVVQDGGAYAYTSTKVLGNATLMCSGPYEIPNVKVDAYSVYTNNIPGGAFRGFGAPQGIFAAETQISRLAEALDMDPVEIRMRNALTETSILPVGTKLPGGVSMLTVIQRCAEEAGWRQTDEGWRAPSSDSLGEPSDPHLKRGIGFACGYKNVGFSFGAPESCEARVELRGGGEIEELWVRHAGADVGQGSHTAIAQMAAEAAGVPIERVRLEMSDTASSGDSGSASASRLTFMAGNAVQGAVEAALQQWESEERPAIGQFVYHPPKTSMLDPKTGESMPNFAYGYVAEAATVDVDTETGQMHVLNVVCADDVGKAINPEQVKGQIEGAVVQAAGYGILENFVQEDGYVQSAHFSTYLIPGILDIPDTVKSVIVEYPDPRGPWGARGMAEMPFIPLAAALTAAVYNAIGVWFHAFPLTPERVLSGIRPLKIQ